MLDFSEYRVRSKMLNVCRRHGYVTHVVQSDLTQQEGDKNAEVVFRTLKGKDSDLLLMT